MATRVFFINFNNMNNLGRESAKDHWCQKNSNLISSFGQDFLTFLFLLVAMATSFPPGIEFFEQKRPPKIIHV